MEYPAQIDCIWLATDAKGSLAAMITAGEGPIPPFTLNSGFDITKIEYLLLDMPIVGDAIVLADVPNPNSFIDLSRRGLFVYDWTDAHKPLTQARGAYALAASPTVAIKLDNLPAALRVLPSSVSHDGVIGGDHLKVS